MNTNDFDFNLPEELIAQTPLEKRDSSKLLVIDRHTHEMVDAHFDHILDELNPGDALVMNNTRVLPARLYGEKPETHGHVELLLLKITSLFFQTYIFTFSSLKFNISHHKINLRIQIFSVRF